MAPTSAIFAYPTDGALSRPLFASTRRPLAPTPVIAEEEPQPIAVEEEVAVAPPPPPPEPPRLAIEGVASIDGERKALVSVAGSASRWIAVDEVIDDWRVAAIRPDGIELLNGDEVHQERLFDD